MDMRMHGKKTVSSSVAQRPFVFKRAPLAQAIVLMLATGGFSGSVQAQQAFSSAWFAAKGAVRSQAAVTGKLPNGMPAMSLSSPLAQQQKANAQLALSINNLNSAARAIAIQQAQQAADRLKAMQGGSVPDGLGEGGLDIDTNTLTAGWLNALGPVQTQSGGRTNVTIQQTADKAILNWETFNVGKNTTLEFLQQKDWAVLNQVNDPLARPSQIQGQIKADGTVMIANRNGIVFTGSSQIDTRNLVAAAAAIDADQFRTNGIYSTQTAGAYNPSFTDANGKLIVESGAQITTKVPTSATQGGGYVLLMGQQVSNAGTITTRQGQTQMAAGDSFVIRKGVATDANQSSSTRGNEIAPNQGSTGQVINTGLLMAREGDITLAGHDVQQQGVAVATTSVNRRGTIHLLNSASDATGEVTLAKDATTAIVLEEGATTALDSQRAALIAASAAQDVVRPGTAVGQFDNLSKLTDRQDQSRVEIVSGGNVNFEGDSLTLATGGQIAVSVTNRSFVADRARLDVSGSVGVNVAMESNNVLVNLQGNELRDSPLNRDSGKLFNNDVWIDRRDLILVPAGTGGATSDRWYAGGGLLEVSGYLSKQGHSIGEWAAQGGTIQLGGKEVITQTGSQINLSGGTFNVQTGYVHQTWLKGSDGHLYNINDAPTDMVFKGVYKGFEATHDRWGSENTEYFYNPLIAPQLRLENGYTVGRDAGRLIVNAPTSVMEGDIVAQVFTGERQIRVRDDLGDGYLQSQTAAAKAATISFGQYGAGGLNGANATDIQVGQVSDITDDMGTNDALDASRLNTTWLDASRLTAQGLGELDLASSQSVKIDAPLTLADGGNLTITAPQIDLNADITAHGGSIVLGNLIRIPPLGTLGEQWITLPGAAGTKPQITIGANSTLDLTGVWTNGLNEPTKLAGLAYLNGGSLTADTSGGITLAAGSVVDVSSGGAILSNGKLQGGKGGNVSLITNNYAHFSNAVWDAADRTIPLIVDGTIRAYGFNGGGTLTLSVPQTVVIGGAASGAVSGPILNLDTSLFQSGFTAYDITGSSGMQIADGATLAPTVPVYRQNAAMLAAHSGSNIADAVELWTPPVFTEDPVHGKLTQRIGVDVTLVSTRGDFLLPKNAAITVDAGHAVDLYINGQTTIEGDITAKGGSIVVGSADERPGQLRVLNGNGDFSLTRSIWIGENAVLDVSGKSYIATDARGRNYGVVQDGGSIELGGADGAASNAFIVIRPGALLDASGASGSLDVATDNTTTNRVQTAGDGGLIALNSNNGIYIDGDLRAAAGGAGASGGTLSMNLVSLLYSPQPATSAVPDGIGVIPDEIQKLRNITIVQNTNGNGLAGNLAPGASDAALQFGQAVIGADQVHAGGFDTLALKTSDLFVFKGDVDLALGRSLTMSGGIYTVADATPNINVKLAAPYIRLDGWTEQQAGARNYSPSLNNVKGPSLKNNDSSFTVSGDLIDLYGNIRFGVYGHQGSGSLSYTSDTINTPDPTTDDITHTSGGDIVNAAGFGLVNFNSSGDVRFGTGTVKTGGDIAITAAQLYPLSGASAALYAGVMLHTNNTGGIQGGEVFDPVWLKTLTIRSNGDATPNVPASAFGNLSFIASTIDQGGVVRAPLGVVSFNSVPGSFAQIPASSTVIFRAGSITSASANGLIIPFGGTVDGVSYQGADGTLIDLGSAQVATSSLPRLATGISVTATSVVGEAGAVLDLTGGGTLTGAGFISGRGGSVDTLKNPLITSNPANTYSSAGNKVYAIMPGYASAYAPAIATNGAGDPAIGRQVTIPAGVPGLPAGTYTLLPSSYALLPGAFRVEVGATATSAMAPQALPSGSYLASGTMSVANTGIHDALPTQLILSSGKEVRSTSQYNEMSYADFARSQAAVFGNVRPRLPDDGKILQFNLGASNGSDKSLSFAGSALFDPVDDGIAGSLLITSSAPSKTIDITASGVVPIVGHTSLSSDDINAFHAATLFIGGAYTYTVDTANGTGSKVSLAGDSNVNVLDGAALHAGEVFVVGQNVKVEGGATIDTRGQSTAGLDSSFGYVFANSADGTTFGPAILAVANGWLNFLPTVGNATMNIASGASLLTEGSIVLAAPGTLTMGDVNFGARYLTVSQNQINAGDAAALAAAQATGVLPLGWNLNQATLDRLMHPSATSGVPALERLTLTAGDAINLFGTVSLDARGQSGGGNGVEFVLNTPAIYGSGNAGDTASIIADSFIWNGVRTSGGTTANPTHGSKAPAAILPGGAGTGSGSLSIQANTITFGYDKDSRPTDGATLDRIAVGFGNVNLTAADLITGNSDGTFSVGQSKDTSGALVGGNLSITTPLLTGENGSTIAYKAGGAVRVTAPAGGVADTSTVTNYGGTVSFTGDSVLFDTAAALSSGKLVLSANGDVVLGGNSMLDLSGRAIAFFDTVKYGWGGDLVMQSAHGDIVQNAGSVIDVSTLNNDAGTITAAADDATHGHIALNGTLKGTATSDYDGGYRGGQISLRAQNMGDFGALNRVLNAAGFFGARNFDLKQGNLVIGDEVKANTVSISVDGGSLTVNGVIDASGGKPGTIRLAARDTLTLASTAKLDTHATQLQMDSNHAPIEADNTGQVELTTSQGSVVLEQGTTIDMRSPDGVARGKIAINVPRLGGTGGDGDGANDIALEAGANVNILGAASIAVNAFRDYQLAGGSVIDQAYFDTVDGANRAFINAAWANGDLQGRLAGLKAYGAAFHLRPGVEIDADGDLTIKGDLDLSGYRYGPDVNSGVRGSGEPGVLVLRVAGNMKINGSINDGFSPPPGTPDDGGWIVMQAGQITSNLTLTQGIVLGAGSTFPVDSVLGYSIPLAGAEQLGAGIPATKTFVLLTGVTLPAGYVIDATIRMNGVTGPGQRLTARVPQLRGDAVTEADWFIAPGSPEGNEFDRLGGADVNFPDGNLNFVTSGMTIPKGSTLPANDTFMSLPAGFIVPANVFPNGIVTAVPRNFVAGTVLTTSVYVAGGTQIPVGFKLPQTVTVRNGAVLRANTLLPQSITLGSDVVVGTAFTTMSEIRTSTQVFAAGVSIPVGTVLPNGTIVGAGNTLPFEVPLANMTWAAGNALSFTSNAITSTDFSITAGQVLPQGTNALGGGGNTSTIGAAGGKNWAVAPMLAPGMQSWSIALVSGADLGAADPHALRTTTALQGSGNLTLDDAHFASPQLTTPLPSVIRTGTGDLDILVGGDYQQKSLFGVYTAGTAIAETGTAANDPYNVARGEFADGTVLGGANDAYQTTLNAQRMYYAEHGGDFLLTAQGDIGGYIKTDSSTAIGNWLWRQGGAGISQATAWGINFGSYVADAGFGGPLLNLDAFSGMGALGGGKVTLHAGRDIGSAAGQGVVVAVGGSGRVMADGSLVQTGGGTLSVMAGRNVGSGGNQFVNLRGDTEVSAGSFGSLTANLFGYDGQNDPRPADTLKSYGMASQPGGSFGVGDGTIAVRTRGDLAMGTIDDPGRVGVGQQTNVTMPTGDVQGASWFTLWTGNTAVDLFAAGGDASPLSTRQAGGTSTAFLPPIMRVAAGNGSIFLTPANGVSYLMPSPNSELQLLARDSIIEAYNAAQAFGTLSTSLSSIATPFNPGWVLQKFDGTKWAIATDPHNAAYSNAWGNPSALEDSSFNQLAYSYDAVQNGYVPGIGHSGYGGGLFVFGPNTVTDDSATGGPNSRIYAVNGDVSGLRYGEIFTGSHLAGGTPVLTDYYRAAKPVDILAGGDIANLKGVILQNDTTDVSTIAAGGSIVYAGLKGPNGTSADAGLVIAGPGTVEVTAGKNIYQGSAAAIQSIGALISGDTRPGANIVLQAGVGQGTPGVGQVDWADFASRYLDPTNLAGPGALASQPGKVAKTYDAELTTWLQQRFGYTGAARDALAYFNALPAVQQRVFLRTVYYAELTAGGREHNDANGPRFGSYLRGRDVIASLFPNDGAYDGDITMFSTTVVNTHAVTSGYAHTDFGGDIQLLAPGGQVVVGTEGLAPGADAGLITQGGGNIQIYSKESLLLGLSRIMTTFGGSILGWSAEGDINAGRGSKTTLVYTPPKLTYDDIGNVTVSPDVPSTGAGIATLAPIPEVPAGDIDLIAPLGTIDAGEAGVRFSGNANFAALQVVNAANIKGDGKVTGVPLVAAVNVAALTNASAAASSAATAAQDVMQRDRNAARQNLPSIFTVRVLGFGNEDGSDTSPKRNDNKSVPVTYDPKGVVEVLGQMDLTEQQLMQLTPTERRNLKR